MNSQATCASNFSENPGLQTRNLPMGPRESFLLEYLSLWVSLSILGSLSRHWLPTVRQELTRPRRLWFLQRSSLFSSLQVITAESVDCVSKLTLQYGSWWWNTTSHVVVKTVVCDHIIHQTLLESAVPNGRGRKKEQTRKGSDGQTSSIILLLFPPSWPFLAFFGFLLMPFFPSLSSSCWKHGNPSLSTSSSFSVVLFNSYPKGEKKNSFLEKLDCYRYGIHVRRWTWS